MIRSALLALLLPLALHAQSATTPLYWPDKNGPTMNGIVPEAEALRLPLEWDEASGKNITWKTAASGVKQVASVAALSPLVSSL